MNMKKLIIMMLILALLCPMAMAETGAPQFTAEAYPIVDGSTATLPLSYALMQAVTGCTEEEAKIAIRHTKTTDSFYSLIYGSADLLIVYEPNAVVFEAAQEANVELEMAAIGRDAMVFLINEDNPVETLTHDQIIDIYTGKTLNWKDVGGDDLDIIAYQRVEDSGSQVMMRKQVMQGIEMADAPTELRTGEMGELIDGIAAYKNTGNAIGYSVYYYVANMYMQEGVRLVNINGVVPCNDSIASGEYPYTQDFYAVIRADTPADAPARQLFDFLQTAEGKSLIENAGYVPTPLPAAE